MSAPLRSMIKRTTDTQTWTYVWLSISMVFLGQAAKVVLTTVTDRAWQMSQGFPLEYYIWALLSLFCVWLASRGQRAKAPGITFGALLGLLAMVLAMLGFDLKALSLTPSFVVTVISLITTYVALFVGWRGDATEKELRKEIQALEAEIQVRGEALAALRGGPINLREGAVVFAGIVILSGLFRYDAKRSRTHEEGSQ